MDFDGRTLSFKQLDDLMLIVHAPVDPDPREWTILMEEGRANAHAYRRCLVSSANVKLTARQRSELGDLVNASDLRVAVLLDSAVTRGIVTALGWVTGRYRAFPMDGIEGAIVYLGGNIDPTKIRDEIRSMQREFIRAKVAVG